MVWLGLDVAGGHPMLQLVLGSRLLCVAQALGSGVRLPSPACLQAMQIKTARKPRGRPRPESEQSVVADHPAAKVRLPACPCPV